MKPLTEEERVKVINYKYHGGDLSPIYQYILSPLAQWCVDMFIPESVAPNVITFAGLLASIFCLFVTLYVNPTLSANGTPSWLCYLVGLGIFTYQTLDNMDGKQARKTGSSSALGMFFDHACDAINAGVTTVTMGAIMGTGWTGKIFITYLSSFLPFYFQTWEENYTDSLILPAFNGPTEGLLMTIGVCIISGLIGTETLHEELFQAPTDFLLNENFFFREVGYPTKQNPSITPFTIMLVIISTCVGPTMVVHVYRAIKRRLENNKEIFVPLLNLFPGLVIMFSTFYYAVNSSIGFKQYPFVTALFYCTMFAEANAHMMVSHIIQRPLLMPERYSVWLLFLLALIVLSGNSVLLEYEAPFLFVSTAISLISFISEFNLICYEFTQALDIYVFKLGKRTEKQD